MIKHIEFLAVGEVIKFRWGSELELKLWLPEDDVSILCAEYSTDLNINIGSYVLVRCYSYPGEEFSSLCCEVISLLKPESFTVKVIPMEEENVFCDLKGNKYVLPSGLYREAIKYAQGYLNVGFSDLPREISEPFYLPDTCTFSPCGIAAEGVIDLCIKILGGEVVPFKEQSDYRLILVRLLEYVNSKRK